MTQLVESPWPALTFGIIALAVLAVVMLRTGRGVILFGMGGVVFLVLLLVGLEWLVVTDREKVENTLHAAAAAIEANDVDRLFQFISPRASFTPQRARHALRQVEFSEARIKNVEVEINELTSPPTAKAKLLAIFSAVDRTLQVPYTGVRIPMNVQLQREEDGRWLITGHDEGHWQDYL